MNERAVTSKGRPSAVNSQRVRSGDSSADLLLKAAGEILTERNSLEVSLSEIAQRSRLNSALIKYYFGNKDGLLLALAKRDATISLRNLEHLVQMNLPAEEKMRIHISGIINSYYRSPYLNRLLHYLIGDGETEAGRRIAEFFVQPMVNAQRAILRQGEAEGRFRPCDPGLFYFSVVGSCDHLFFAISTLKHIIDPRGMTDDLRQRYIAHVTELCLGGLLIPNRGTAPADEAVIST